MAEQRQRLINAINATNAQHDYVPDKRDDWRVTALGDCEDYSLYVLWIYARKSRIRFALTLLFGPWRYWYVDVSGDGHFMVEYTKTGEFFENSFGVLRPGRYYFGGGWTKGKPFSRFYLIRKVIRGLFT